MAIKRVTDSPALARPLPVSRRGREGQTNGLISPDFTRWDRDHHTQKVPRSSTPKMRGEASLDKFQEPCLVIGAGGMLGTDLILALNSSGLRAVALGRDEADVRRFESVREQIQRWNPGTVFNCAAFTDVDGCESNQEKAFAVNARGAEHVARACSQSGAVLVHISSDYVFDGKKRGAYQEEEEVNPLGVYGKSKAEGERLVRETLPRRHCIVRTRWLFGLHGKNFVESILRQTQERSRLMVVNDQYGSPTYAADLSLALIRICKCGGLGTFHVTNSGVTTWFEFARAIVELSGLSGVRVEPVETGRLNRPAPRPPYSALDNSRYVSLVGSALRGWQDALRAYLTDRTGRCAPPCQLLPEEKP